ncbi:MAG: cation-translocating P-type ATPase [Nitrospiraceae bacterium]|nr:cation-translocating P-type ATPase [Nitrospiraceae bacterium]
MSAEGFDIREVKGLSEAEAGRRLRAEGPNELPQDRGAKQRLIAVAARVFGEPMFLLLIAGGVIYLLLGDRGQAVTLLGFVAVVMGLTIYQEGKTERALGALRDLASPRARVVRDGAEKRVPGWQVVRGDIIIISEGDRVPADAVLTVALNLLVDEAALTGESAPVRKTPYANKGLPGAMERPGGEGLPFVYSGTLAVAGFGVARVLAVGAATEMGKIGRALLRIKAERTPLQKKTDRLVGSLAAAGLSVCVMVAVLYGIARHYWLEGFLAGVTLAMAVLPEEFPMVLSVFLALGAWRMSRKNVLARRVPVVETLGAATVLCVDKTGTITANRMAVKKIYRPGDSASGVSFFDAEASAPGGPVPEEFHEIIEYAILASRKDPFDPMEKALRDAGGLWLVNTEHIHEDWTLVQEYPVSGKLLAMSRVWKADDRGDYIIAAKGAPEAVGDICHMDEEEGRRLAVQVDRMAGAGLRVIGVAGARSSRPAPPGGQHAFTFQFMGLIGLADPVRPGVDGALRECRGAGIRVLMITGDYPVTARMIAARIGLGGKEPRIVSGLDLERMDDWQLRRRISDVDIFCRMLPEHKLRIVNALKANGEVVAMTGDGVNDAPALKAADIGIAMGAHGTDVAREASGLVLLDDDFSSIVQGVRMGRRILDNLKKAAVYVLAIHVPIAGMALIPVILGMPLVFMPVHIVFLELIIDPACSVVFEAEPEERDVMARPPVRPPEETLLDRRRLFSSLLQGGGVLAAVLAVFLAAVFLGRPVPQARALGFTTLVIANLALIFSNRSRTRSFADSLRVKNRALWWVVGGAAIFLAAVLYEPSLRGAFRFGALAPGDIVVCLAAGAASVFSLDWLRKLKSALIRP